MTRRALYAVCLDIIFFASAALSQTSQFNISSMGSEKQTRLIVELMATNGVDIDKLIEGIPSADVMGMNQFDYRRYYEEEVLAIRNAPSLWRVGEAVTLTYSSVAQLNSYDFNEGVYFICVPTMFVPINASPDGIWPPNVQMVFAPSNSTPGNGARAGGRCDPGRAVFDYVGKGIFDFNSIRVKMSPDQAEELYQRSLSSPLGEGVVGFSVTCIVGPGTTNGAYCSVESGLIVSGASKYPIDRYDVASIRAAEDAAIANAAALEAERVASLPGPTVSECPASGNTTWASQYPNCELILFENAGKRYKRSTLGDASGRSFCQYVEPKGGDITWEWKEDGIVDVIAGPRLPASAVVFEIPTGEAYSGFLCGYSTISDGGISSLATLLEGLGGEEWGGYLIQPRSKPRKMLLQSSTSSVNVGYPEKNCFGQWAFGSSENGLITESISSGGCYDGAFVRLKWKSKTELIVELRKNPSDGEPAAIAVLQPRPLFR